MTAKPRDSSDAREPEHEPVRPALLCSGLNCVIASDVREIKDNVALLVRAVHGEEKSGLKGLVRTQADHAADIASLKADRNRVTAWAVAVVVLLGALWEIAKTIFKR